MGEELSLAAPKANKRLLYRHGGWQMEALSRASLRFVSTIA